VYWTFAALSSEMLAAGNTTVAEFFYLNGAGNAHAEAAIRAARDTGIRLVLARTWMDAENAPPEFSRKHRYCRRANLERSKNYIPKRNVCVSASLAARGLNRNGARRCRVRTPIRLHAARSRGGSAVRGRATLDASKRTPIELLDDLGALNERTVAIHAIYISPQDRDLIARSGARVIHNPMTINTWATAFATVRQLQSMGVKMGLGTDADVKPSLPR